MMRRYQSLDLKWKLMIPFGLMTVLWAATGTFLLTRTALSRTESRVQSELQQEMRAVGSTFADTLAGQIELVRLAANTQGVSDALKSGNVAAMQELVSPLLANSRTDLMVLVDAEGSEILSLWRGEVGPEAGAANLGKELFEVLPRPGGVSSPTDKYIFLSSSSRGRVFMTGGPIREVEAPLGFVLVGSRAEPLADRLANSGGGAVSLYDPSGNFVSSSGKVVRLTPDMLSGTESRRSLVGRREVLVGPLIGRGRVVAVIAVFGRPGELLNEVRKMGLGFGLVGLTAILGVIGLGLLLARAITAPLERVAATARSIAKGDLSKRAEVRAGDEIGQLGDSFNTMADRLQSSYEELERRVEERTKALSAANEELERLAQAKSQFLANMSHELRTPLNAILGYSEVLLDPFFGPVKPAEVRKRAKAIHSSGSHLLNLINDLLDLSKIEAGKLELFFEEVPLKPTIQELLRLVGPMAVAKNLRVKAKLRYAPEAARADEKRFRQIVLNLLSNAIKFTPEGGSIAIEAMEERGRLYLTVTDTGIGIPQEHLERIFEQFSQVDGSYTRKQEGTGLGLALTRQLVELHGGRIYVESEERKGTRFTVELPLRRMRRATRRAS